MAETKRLMITSTIKMTLVRIRKDPRTVSKAIIWKDNKTLLNMDSSISTLKISYVLTFVIYSHKKTLVETREQSKTT